MHDSNILFHTVKVACTQIALQISTVGRQQVSAESVCME
jgi:hypothetical protein